MIDLDTKYGQDDELGTGAGAGRGRDGGAEMKWYTCIIHMPRHVSPLQLFHTRAENATDAVVYATRWMLDGQWTPEDIDVPLVFEGRLEPASSIDIDIDGVNAAIGWTDPNVKEPS